METDKPPIPTHKPSISTADWLKWLGERRDGFLIGGAVLYGLGYLVWSYNAWRNHLGQLPAIEFQYVVSGLIPGAVIVMTWAAIRFFSSMRDKANTLYEKYRVYEKYRSQYRWIIMALMFLQALLIWTLVLLSVTHKRWLGMPAGRLFFYVGPLIAVAMYFTLVAFTPLSRQGRSRVIDQLLQVYRYFFTFMFCWFSLFLYVSLYPRLPQELGGPRPRCAYIDLVREDLAPSSLSALVPSHALDAATASQSKVVRSNKLNVYFSSSDYLLVRTVADTKDAGSANLKNAPLYELRKEVIRLVEWCPE